MNTRFTATPSWTTSSFSDTVDTSPLDLSALGAHLELCNGSRGRLFGLRCAAESMNGFVTARLVTKLVAAGLLIGLGCLLL